MAYTQYRPIVRDDAGNIQRQGAKLALGRRGIEGVPAAEATVVVSVEPCLIAGWDGATAIGLVQRRIDGVDDGPPVLAFLAA